MVRGRVEHVRIATGDGQVVALSSAAAQELKRQLLGAGAGSLVEQFERVGTSRPLVLDRVDRQPLLRAVLVWIRLHGEEHVPDGVLALRDALRAHHAQNPWG